MRPPARFPHGGHMSRVSSEEIFSDIAHLLVSESSPERVLEAVADALGQLVPHDMLQLYRADSRLRLLQPVVVRDTYAEEIWAMGPLPYGVGITGAAVETGLAQLVNDAHLDDRAQLIPGTPDEPESLIAIPLLAPGETKGALCLTRLGEGNHFSDEEFRLAIRFAELAALVIENAQARARLETEAVTDHLTGLYNRRYFQARLREEMSRNSRRGRLLALVMFDIDDFKWVNDRYGHQTGDQILSGLGSIARESCRGEDIVCRIGGEEFAVVLPGAGASEASVLAERLRARVEDHSFPVVQRVTVSVGIAEAPVDAETPHDLLARADAAMLEGKAAGKNRVIVYGERPEAPTRSFTRRAQQAPHPSRRPGGLEDLWLGVATASDVHGIARAITRGLGPVLAHDTCAVHIFSAPQGNLELLSCAPSPGEKTQACEADHEADHEVARLVASTGRPVCVPVASGSSPINPLERPDPGSTAWQEIAPSHWTLCVPVATGERTLGTVTISKLGGAGFHPDDARLLEVLASHAAVAVENRRAVDAAREAAAAAARLLALARSVLAVPRTEDVVREVLARLPEILQTPQPWAVLRERPTGRFKVIGSAAPAFRGRGVGQALLLPLRWEPNGQGALVLPERGATPFTEEDRRVGREVAELTSGALSAAARAEMLAAAAAAPFGARENELSAENGEDREDLETVLGMALATELEQVLHLRE